MTPLLGLGVLAGLGLLLGSRSSARSSAPVNGSSARSSTSTAKELADQIAREAKEIVRGDREAFTDDDPFGQEDDPESEASSVASEPEDDARLAAEQAAALAAAELAADDDDDDEPAAKKPAAKKPAAKKPAAKKPAAKKPAAKKPAAKKPAARTVTLPPIDNATNPIVAPAPSGSDPPPGYDPDGARRMVPSVENNLKNKGKPGYDRLMLKSFQTKAGIEPDRIYGGATRGALLYYGARNPPQPFYAPKDTIPYVPPA